MYINTALLGNGLVLIIEYERPCCLQPSISCRHMSKTNACLCIYMRRGKRQWKGYLSERNFESTQGSQTQGIHRDAFVQQDSTRSRKWADRFCVGWGRFRRDSEIQQCVRKSGIKQRILYQSREAKFEHKHCSLEGRSSQQGKSEAGPHGARCWLTPPPPIPRGLSFLLLPSPTLSHVMVHSAS